MDPVESEQNIRSFGTCAMAQCKGSGIDTQPLTRTRGQTCRTIDQLPVEVLNEIFCGIHICDLQAVRRVCKLFREVTEIPSVWTHASFASFYPNKSAHLQVFIKAANYNNFEATIKLAVARLYNDGLPDNHKLMSITTSSALAADYFLQAQRLAPAVPFIWLLLRPPWAPTAMSLKGCTSQKLLENSVTESHGAVTMSMAHLLQLTERSNEALEFTIQAAKQGCQEAMTLKWKYKYAKELASSKPIDVARELAAMRELRAVASDRFSKLLLCAYYVSGRLGGISLRRALAFTRHVFQSSKPFNILPFLTSPHRVTPSIRYILIDWMADVASMPTLNLNHHTLMCAVDIMDRCIAARNFTISNLQLLGVAALVITSRYMSENILTVTNAVASTASTWTYSEVVQMIAEVIAIRRGQIRELTSLDYVGVLEKAVDMENMTKQVVYFILALCMLQPSLTVYSPSHLASCAVLLARTLTNFDEIWPAKLQGITGFHLKDLIPCAIAIHHKCLLEDMQYDPNGIPMKGVRMRFTDCTSPYDMSALKIPTHKELQQRLGVVRPVTYSSRSKLRVHVQDLICSPCRGKKVPPRCCELERPSREDAATPPLDLDTSGYQGDYEYDTDPSDLSDSFISTQSDDIDVEQSPDSFVEVSAEPMMPCADPPTSSLPLSRIAISSPQGIMINISNPSFSLSTSNSSAIDCVDSHNVCRPSSSGMGASVSSVCSISTTQYCDGALKQSQAAELAENGDGFQSVCCEMPQPFIALSHDEQNRVQVACNSKSCAEIIAADQLPYPVMESCALQSENAHSMQLNQQTEMIAFDKEEVNDTRQGGGNEPGYGYFAEPSVQSRESVQEGFRPLIALQPHQHFGNQISSAEVSKDKCVCLETLAQCSVWVSRQHSTPTEGCGTVTAEQVVKGKVLDAESIPEELLICSDKDEETGHSSTEPDAMQGSGIVSGCGDVPSTSGESPINFGFPIAESSPLKTVWNRSRARRKSSRSSSYVSLLFNHCTSTSGSEKNGAVNSDVKQSPVRRKRSNIDQCTGPNSTSLAQGIEREASCSSPPKRKSLNVPNQITSPCNTLARSNDNQ